MELSLLRENTAFRGGGGALTESGSSLWIDNV